MRATSGLARWATVEDAGGCSTEERPPERLTAGLEVSLLPVAEPHTRRQMKTLGENNRLHLLRGEL